MKKYLNTEQVQEILGVDRITIYRMLNDGRLKGVKVGNQWRFSQTEINRILGEPSEENDAEATEVDLSDFPTDCVEKLQEVFAGILGVGAITVNLQGEPITKPVFSNPFCQLMLANPNSQKACQESWRKIANKVTKSPYFHICHAGLCYIRSPIKMNEKRVAWMVTGQFYNSAQNSEELNTKVEELADKYNFLASELKEGALNIPVLKHSQQMKVQEWAPKVTDTVQSMLCERSDLVKRLERISEISSIRPSLNKNSESK
jgi:excisionase family DNA binding protein